MRPHIFQAIAQAVAAVPGVAHVGLWNQQVQYLSGGTAWPVPAVFVEFERLQWGQQLMGTRRGQLHVALHVVTRAVPTPMGHLDQRMPEALSVYGLLDDIGAAMQGLMGQHFSGFMLTASDTCHDHAELVEHLEHYVCSVQDVSALRRSMEPPQAPDLNIERG